MFGKIKRTIKLLLRYIKDVQSGQLAKFCRKNDSIILNYALDFRQDIKPSTTFANKVYNLQQAGKMISEYIIQPREIFSFWQIIGNPKHCFKSSRSIIKGQVVNEIGGGICQVSGLIYFAAIKAKLEILERHNHSLDLYTEETRFAPLGSDATVVYGYKDLRIRNSFDFPIKFVLTTIDDNKLAIQLRSQQPIVEHNIIFERQDFDSYCEVRVCYSDGTLINYSRYGYLVGD